MNRNLLLAAAFAAATTANAQVFRQQAEWSQTMETVAAEADHGSANVAVDKAGNVYRTAAYNKAVAVGGVQLANDDAMLRPVLVKYGSGGAVLWAVSIDGAATVSSIAEDGQGNVYIAGTHAGEVTLNSTDGAARKITGLQSWGEYVEGKLAAYIAKYGKDGQLLAVREIKAEEDAVVAESDMHTDSWLGEPSKVATGKVAASGAKVYLAITCKGDLKLDNVAWEGRYVNQEGMYTDEATMGVLAFDAADLSNAEAVVAVAAKDMETTFQYQPESMCFAVDGDAVYAAFFGYGSLAVELPGLTQPAEFAYNTDGTGRAHGVVIAKVSGGTATAKVVSVDKVDPAEAPNYSMADMAVEGGKLYIAGTSAATNALKPDMAAVGSTNIFAAKIDAGSLAVEWVAGDAVDEGDVNHFSQGVKSMAVADGGVFVSGYTVKTSDNTVESVLNYDIEGGALKTSAIGGGSLFESLCVAGGFVAAATHDGAKAATSLYRQSGPAGIQSAAMGKAAGAAVYGMDGKAAGPAAGGLKPGVYVVKQGGKAVKAVVR